MVKVTPKEARQPFWVRFCYRKRNSVRHKAYVLIYETLNHVKHHYYQGGDKGGGYSWHEQEILIAYSVTKD